MSKRIMIVDDSSSFRQLMRITLKEAGYEIVEAINGTDALDKLKDGIDMVITDLNMPYMDGIALIKELRKLSPFKFTPVIMLTTVSQGSRKEEGRQAGATAWITKPFKPEQLLIVIKRIMNN